MEDVDLEIKLGLEYKLANLIERLDLREAGSSQKTSNVTPSGTSKGPGNLSLSGISPTPEMAEKLYASQYVSGQKGWKSLSRTSDPCPPEPLHFPEVSKKTPHRCEACEKLGHYWGPPLLVCALMHVYLRIMANFLLHSIQRDAHTHKSVPTQRPRRSREKGINMVCNQRPLKNLG